MAELSQQPNIVLASAPVPDRRSRKVRASNGWTPRQGGGMKRIAHVLSWSCARAFGVGVATLGSSAARAADSAVPKYEVDPSWPKPFPNQWVFGGLGGICID